MNVNAIRQELAAKFTGFHGYSVEPPAPEFPYVVVPLPAIDYESTNTGLIQLNFRVRIGVSTSDETQADTFLGDTLTNLVATLRTSNPTTFRFLEIVGTSTPTNPQIGSATGRQLVIEIVVHA